MNADINLIYKTTMISDLLKIQKGVTSIIGGGGKTTLIHTLANELKNKGTVIITTTTHIMPSAIFYNVTDDSKCLSHLSELLCQHKCICLGKLTDNGKLCTTQHTFSDLCKIADYVLVEADGSKGLPLKAHLDFEPVIPVLSTQVITVVGVDCVREKLEDVTHRAEKACEILACKKEDIITEKMVATLLIAEKFHSKVLLNKCDSENERITAETISGYIKTECVISSLHKGEWYVSSN